MRILETKVYNFEELKQDAKEKAIENLADINVDFDWYDYDGLLGLSAQEMKDRRILMSDKWYESDKPKNSQGNIKGEYPAHTGLITYKIAAFSIDRNYFIQFTDIEVNCDDTFRKFLRISKRLWENCYYTFSNRSGGFLLRHSNTVFEIESDWKDYTERQQEIVDRAVEIMTDKIAEALISLQNSYEYLTSEEAIIETIKANEYEFSINGGMI